MKEYCVAINAEFLVCAEDEDDAMNKAFDRFIDKGYRETMNATPTGIDYDETSGEETTK